jgi:hypothetical protein
MCILRSLRYTETERQRESTCTARALHALDHSTCLTSAEGQKLESYSHSGALYHAHMHILSNLFQTIQMMKHNK